MSSEISCPSIIVHETSGFIARFTVFAQLCGSKRFAVIYSLQFVQICGLSLNFACGVLGYIDNFNVNELNYSMKYFLYILRFYILLKKFSLALKKKHTLRLFFGNFY